MLPWMARATWVGCAALVALAGCGGKVVVDAGTSGTGGGGGSTQSTASGTIACDDPGDCPPNNICVFSTGVCSPTCSEFTPCPVGQVCDPCGSSSCPGCDDCVPACIGADPGQCDDHDDCSAGTVCVFFQQTCAPPCNDDLTCTDPDLVCDPCATSSCPGCENCAAACVGF